MRFLQVSMDSDGTCVVEHQLFERIYPSHACSIRQQRVSFSRERCGAVARIEPWKALDGYSDTRADCGMYE